MRPTEDLIIASVLPKARLGTLGVHSDLDFVLKANFDETYFGGPHRWLFRLAVAGNVQQVPLDDDIVVALLEQEQCPPGDRLPVQILFRDLAALDVPREKLKIILPAYRERVHADRMAVALEEAAGVLVDGLKVDGEVQQGYKAARTHIMTRLAELDQKETGVLPVQDIRDCADQLATEYAETKKGREPGIMTGWSGIDTLTNGFQKGELAIFCAYTGEGKATCLTTPIPTPRGWTTMGEIQVGDELFDETGRITRVSYKSPVHVNHTCYRVRFQDGEEIIADAEHRWAVRQWMWKADRPLVVKTTAEMAQDYLQSGRPRYAIPGNGALDLPDADLPIDPYVLGVWLGNGSTGQSQVTTPDREVVRVLEAVGHVLRVVPSSAERTAPVYCVDSGTDSEWRSNAFTTAPRDLAVLHDKHIPLRYLRGSIAQRLALLQGLMDTEGHCTKRGQCAFSSTDRALAEGVKELAHTLGIKAGWSEGRAMRNGVDDGPKYRVQFTTDMPVFRTPRKLAPLEARTARVRPDPRITRRYIVAIEPVDSVPVQCLQVEAESHLFLVGRSMVPTHNTQTLLNVGYHASVYQKKNTVFVSLEMPLAQVRRRIIARHTNHHKFGLPGGLDYVRIKNGQLDPYEEKLYMQVIDDWRDSSDYGRFTVLQISKYDTVKVLNEKLMYLRSRQSIDLVCLDYASLMAAIRRRSDRREEIVEVIEGLKALSLTFNEGEGLCMVTANQISRKAREEADSLRRYGLNFASETSAIEKNADFLAWLLRLDEFKTNKEVLMGVGKYRDGDVGSEFRLMERYESSLLADVV